MLSNAKFYSEKHTNYVCKISKVSLECARFRCQKYLQNYVCFHYFFGPFVTIVCPILCNGKKTNGAFLVTKKRL